MVVTLSELLNMLQVAEELIIHEKGSLMVMDKSISHELKPMGKKFKKKKASHSKKENMSNSKKKDNRNCFHFGKTGHWKRNCPAYLASLKKNNPSKGIAYKSSLTYAI